MTSRNVEDVSSGDWIKINQKWRRVNQTKKIPLPGSAIYQIFYDGGGRIPLNRRRGDTILWSSEESETTSINNAVGPLTRELGL